MQLSNIKALKDVSIHVGSVFKMTFYPQDGVSPKGDHAIGRDKYFVIAGIDSEGNYIGATKLLQKSEMRKDIVIELSYKGFG